MGERSGLRVDVAGEGAPSPFVITGTKPGHDKRGCGACLRKWLTLTPSPLPSGRGDGLSQFRAEALDALASVLQERVRGRVGDAQVRAEAEGRALHGRDALRLQEFGDEIRIALDPLARGCRAPDRLGAGWIDVERAFRRRAADVAGLIEHRDYEVAPFFEGFAEHRQVVLRPVERLDRRPLGDRAGA